MTGPDTPEATAEPSPAPAPEATPTAAPSSAAQPDASAPSPPDPAPKVSIEYRLGEVNDAPGNPAVEGFLQGVEAAAHAEGLGRRTVREIAQELIEAHRAAPIESVEGFRELTLELASAHGIARQAAERVLDAITGDTPRRRFLATARIDSLKRDPDFVRALTDSRNPHHREVNELWRSLHYQQEG